MSKIATFESVEKHYNGRTILDIGSLTFQYGTIYHLSGRNGAGKTTLLKVIAGLEAPHRATVSFDDRPRPWHKALPRLRRDVIYVHQQAFMFDAAVETNLAYGLRARGMPRRERCQHTYEALQHLGLAQLAGRHARTLSGGERQWVALVRAWILKPRILLLDEPTTNMDTVSREQTWLLLTRLLDENICVVITSHDHQSLAGIPHHRLHLEDGNIVQTCGDQGEGGNHTDSVIALGGTRPQWT